MNAFRDRHGRLRHYFRRPGCKSVALPGLPGSVEFMEAYQAALAGETTPRTEIGARRTKPGTIAALTVEYFNSLAFHSLAHETKRNRRNILERFRTEHGDKRIALLERKHIEKMVVAKTAIPAAARNFLNTIRSLLQFAVDTGIRPDNPAVGVKRVKIKTDGYRTWTEDDIAAFEARHPVGTRARSGFCSTLDSGAPMSCRWADNISAMEFCTSDSKKRVRLWRSQCIQFYKQC